MPMYHDGNRALQDQFGSTKLADRLVEQLGQRGSGAMLVARAAGAADLVELAPERDELVLEVRDALVTLLEQAAHVGARDGRAGCWLGPRRAQLGELLGCEGELGLGLGPLLQV